MQNFAGLSFPDRLPLFSVVRRLAVYALVATGGAALFIWLHHLGNQLPYELAQQRFAEASVDVARENGAQRYFQGKRPLFINEFCELSVGVLAGGGGGTGQQRQPLVDAVLPKSFHRDADANWGYCQTLLQAAVDGREFKPNVMKTRYWWGSKALLAVALRHLSVWELHRSILLATYGAWLLLAVATALLGWRALLVASPTIVFGMTLSGIPYFADIANGLPTLWAVFAAGILALMLRQPKAAQLAPRFCFITGMVSSFLWLSDGHNSLAIALIGLVAWLGHERTKAGGETRRAFHCVLLYVAGFVACLVLGQAAKYAVFQQQHGSGIYIVNNFLASLSHRLDQAFVETWDSLQHGEAALVQACEDCGTRGWQKLPIARNFRGLPLLTPFSQEVHWLLNAFSAMALACGVGGAVWQARRGRRRLANNILWLVALALMALTQLFLPTDIGFRNDRFVFLLLAACWSCLAVAAVQLNRKGFSMLAGCLVGGLFVSIAAVDRVMEWRLDWRLDRTIANAHLVVQSGFDVYDDYDRLIYLKDDCEDAATEPRFFLHVRPVDRADLPEHRQKNSFDNLDFNFHEHGHRIGERCVAMRSLPDYDMHSVATGQYSKAGRIWSFEFTPRKQGSPKRRLPAPAGRGEEVRP